MAAGGLQEIVMGIVVLSGYVLAPKSDLAAIKAALPEHIRLTRNEPGCIIFRVEQEACNPLRFDVYEEFETKTDFENHQARIIGTKWAGVTKNMERHFTITTG